MVLGCVDLIYEDPPSSPFKNQPLGTNYLFPKQNLVEREHSRYKSVKSRSQIKVPDVRPPSTINYVNYVCQAKKTRESLFSKVKRLLKWVGDIINMGNGEEALARCRSLTLHGRIRVWPGHSLRSGHPGTRRPHAGRPRSGTPHSRPRSSRSRRPRPSNPAPSWAARTPAGRHGRRHPARGHRSRHAELLLPLRPGGDDGGHGARRTAGDGRDSAGRPHDAGGDAGDAAGWHAPGWHTARRNAPRRDHARWDAVRWWEAGGRKSTCGWNAPRRHPTHAGGHSRRHA